MIHPVRSFGLFVLGIVFGLTTRPVFGLQPALHPRVVSTQYPTSDYVVACSVATESPYSAPADGKTDATAAIQSAIDAVAQSGGGVVFLPAGRYLFKGDLLVKEGVTLRGDYEEPDPDHDRYQVAGTILMPTADRGNPDGPPFITLERGSGIRNLSIWYPDQNSNSITPYPWTVNEDQHVKGDCYTVEYATLVNSYQGVKFGPMGNEIGTIRHVYGTPLLTGVSANSITDIPRIEHMRFSPLFWMRSGLPGSNNASAVKAQLLSHATGIEMRLVDWFYLFDVATSGYSVGFRLANGERGTTCGVLYDGAALDGDVGVQVDACKRYFLFDNCRFDGATAAVAAGPQFTTELQFENCRLGGTAKRAMDLAGPGIVKVQDSEVAGSGGPAVEATKGQLQLVGCTYPGDGRRILLGPQVKRALIAGGIDKDGVDNRSTGDVQIDRSFVALPRPGAVRIVLPDDPRPAKPQLYNVLDYGARADGDDANDATDNTAPFQKALDMAGANGGGTVYVPGGSYRFSANLQVPSGVELRGVFDVPHHTQSWGSTLMPAAGRGQEDGVAFISLQTGSGLRGLTFWYPDQKQDDIVAYPWTVQARGPDCWLIDVTSANSYQYADFGSFPSEGSLLRFVSGAPLRRGIWVSKGSAGSR